MDKFANYSPKVLGRLRRKDWDSKETYLRRVKKRLGQVENELAIWITSPIIEGIRVTHDLENEKELILKIIHLVENEEGDKIPFNRPSVFDPGTTRYR